MISKNKTYQLQPPVSIIIRTYNEELKIKRCLEAIFDQKTNFPFEVIIVDSQSNDKTLKIAQAFPVKIITIEKSDFTYGRALNYGAQQAVGKFLVFISAHASPTNNNWLNSLIENFNDSRLAGVYGTQLSDNNCNPLTKRHLMDHAQKKGKNIIIQYNNYDFCNANSAITKAVWQIINFDENLKYCEDSDWAKKVMSLGYLISYNPKAQVYHSHNENLKQIYQRHYREFYSTLLIENKILKIRFITNLYYNLLMDFIYLLKNKYHVHWFYRAIINQFIIGLALINASWHRVIDIFILARKKYRFGYLRQTIYQNFNRQYEHYQLKYELLNFLQQAVKYQTVKKVSVVIPTRNRLQTLTTNTLAGLLKQDYPHQDFEIVIADNSDNDETFNYLEKIKLTTNVRIKIIRNNKAGIGRIMNQATQSADGDIIMTSGDDSIIDENWIKRTVAFYNNGKYLVGQGYVYDEILQKNMNPEKMDLSNKETFFVDGNISFLRSILKYVSINNEIIYGAEGYDLASQILTFWPNFNYFVDQLPIKHTRARSEYRPKNSKQLNKKGYQINQKMYRLWHINKHILKRNLDITDKNFKLKFWLKEIYFMPIEMILFMNTDLPILVKTKIKIYHQLLNLKKEFYKK